MRVILVMNNKAQTVVLIHGLWMNGLIFLAHQSWLSAEGFAVHRFSYPSMQGGMNDNVQLLSNCINNTAGSSIHLVAHSLGGLVALKMLSHEPDVRIRSLVLLGTPYKGCHCGLTLAKTPLLKAIVGRTFNDWLRLPCPAWPSGVEVGVISGTRPIGLGRLIPGLAHPNDGVIAVEETYIPVAKDSIALNVNHSGMLLSRTCSRQISHFIRTGSFLHV